MIIGLILNDNKGLFTMNNLIRVFIVFSLLISGCNSEQRQDQEEQKQENIPKVNEGRLVHMANFASKFVSARDVDIWLPEDYSEKNSYAVIYMNDGQTLFDPKMSWLNKEWGVDEMMAKLLKTNAIKNTIIVGISNSGLGRVDDYFPQKPFESLSVEYKKELRILLDKNEYTTSMMRDVHSDNYLKFLVEELKPFIDKKYSTFTDKKNTFIMGSSYGGLISMYAISEYPDIFGGAACLSTHWIGTFEDNPIIAQSFIDYFNENIPSPIDHKIYFDYGSETLDQYYKPYQLKIDAIMKAKGYTDKNWKTLEFVGENHSEEAWSKRLDIPFMFLVGI